MLTRPARLSLSAGRSGLRYWATLLGTIAQLAHAAPPPLQVHPQGHYFQVDGRPFTWMADTAWQLIHGATRAEVAYYLSTRARQGFNVIQTVVLAEFDGVRQASALGLRPFQDDDPDRPEPAYFDHVVEVVDEAARLGLYVALLPVWGDKLEGSWGAGPALFKLADLPKARRYAEYLAARLAGRTNVIWMLGGDRPPFVDASSPQWLRDYLQRESRRETVDWRPIWREMAAGIRKVAGDAALIGFHPAGGLEGTSQHMHGEPWLAFHGLQSGHGAGHDTPVWDAVDRDFALPRPKPVVDLEVNYEDHPVNPWPVWNPALGYFRDDDVRRQVYRALFAGAAGVSYGHHAVWQLAGARREPVNYPDRDWQDALWRPGGRQMGLARALMDSRASFGRRPLPALLRNPWLQPACHAVATGDLAAGMLMVYVPCASQPIEVDLRGLHGRQLTAWWFDPRTGVAEPAGRPLAAGGARFTTPAHGPDWVLVIDDEARGFSFPGLPQ